MDDKDTSILTLLQENARLSLSELARRSGLSRSTVQDRIARMEQRGVIAGYGVRMGADVRARQVRALVMLKIMPRAQDGVVGYCQREKAVRSLYTISGEFDLAALLVAETTAALDTALDAIGRQKGVERTQTSVLLSTKFDRGD